MVGVVIALVSIGILVVLTIMYFINKNDNNNDDGNGIYEEPRERETYTPQETYKAPLKPTITYTQAEQKKVDKINEVKVEFNKITNEVFDFLNGRDKIAYNTVSAQLDRMNVENKYQLKNTQLGEVSKMLKSMNEVYESGKTTRQLLAESALLISKSDTINWKRKDKISNLFDPIANDFDKRNVVASNKAMINKVIKLTNIIVDTIRDLDTNDNSELDAKSLATIEEIKEYQIFLTPEQKAWIAKVDKGSNEEIKESLKAIRLTLKEQIKAWGKGGVDSLSNSFKGIFRELLREGEGEALTPQLERVIEQFSFDLSYIDERTFEAVAEFNREVVRIEKRLTNQRISKEKRALLAIENAARREEEAKAKAAEEKLIQERIAKNKVMIDKTISSLKELLQLSSGEVFEWAFNINESVQKGEVIDTKELEQIQKQVINDIEQAKAYILAKEKQDAENKGKTAEEILTAFKKQQQQKLRIRKQQSIKFERSDMETAQEYFNKLRERESFTWSELEGDGIESITANSGVYSWYVELNGEKIYDLIPAYVGQAKNLRARIKEHMRGLSSVKQDLADGKEPTTSYEKATFFIDNREFLIEDIHFTIIEEFNPKTTQLKEQLNDSERFHIASLNSAIAGFNRNKGNW